MAILHKLLFFLVLGLICAGAFALTLEFLGAGGYAQTKFDYTLDLAQQGNARAQVNLGLMYYKGEGVLEDYVQAYAWWNIAATRGDEDAKTNKESLKKEMTREQIAKGQELATECWKKYVVPFQKD